MGNVSSEMGALSFVHFSHVDRLDMTFSQLILTVRMSVDVAWVPLEGKIRHVHAKCNIESET